MRSLLDTAVTQWSQLHRRVGTGRLNQALKGWMTHYKLPVRGKNYKIRFMTQVGTNPVRFVAFVNRMSGFPEGYAGYLENCIRRDLGFGQVPVTVEFRQSAKAVRGRKRSAADRAGTGAEASGKDAAEDGAGAAGALEGAASEDTEQAGARATTARGRTRKARRPGKGAR